MADLRFSGVVRVGNPSRNSESEGEVDGAVFIGERDIVKEVSEQDFGRVSIFLNGAQIASGLPSTAIGWGYSEWTPMEDDKFQVDGADIIEALERLKGEVVELVIEDDSP